jgi:uncharacterized protein (TIGR04255 family)
MEAMGMAEFSLNPVQEVPLHAAPLAKVLTQVQFSRTPQLVTDAAEAQIAEALGRYPVRRRAVPPALVINGQPVPSPQAPAAVLTFADPVGTWQVTLTDTAVALETSEYESRDDFCERALEVFRAVAASALPPVVDRVGLRYIDRLSGAALSRVTDYVAAPLQVLFGHTAPELELQHSVTDSLVKISADDVLQIRTGFLPPQASFDPALAPLPGESWVLDMDAYTSQAGFPFDPDALVARLRKYSEAAYAFFRWATTDAFQDDHIGAPAAAEDFR